MISDLCGWGSTVLWLLREALRSDEAHVQYAANVRYLLRICAVKYESLFATDKGLLGVMLMAGYVKSAYRFVKLNADVLLPLGVFYMNKNLLPRTPAMHLTPKHLVSFKR